MDKAPPILVVQLKRFDVMSGGGKINKTITFREQLDIAQVMSEDKKVLALPYSFGVKCILLSLHRKSEA